MKTLLLASALLTAVLPAFAAEPADGNTTVITAAGTVTATVNGKPVEVTQSNEGTLVIKGPVVAAPVAPVAKATPASGYELRGFFGSGEKLEVSVRVPGSTESKWLKVGKKSGGLLIEKADSRAGTAVLLVDGRRVALALSGETAAPIAAEVAKPAAETSDAEKARQARHERFRVMRENATPEQQAEFGRVMREKFEATQKEHPELMNRENFNDPEKRKAMGEVFRANMREAAEAAAKLPGKDGKVAPVPEDFNQLLIDEGKDMEARGGEFRARRNRGAGQAGAESAPAAVRLPAPAPTDK